MNIDDLQHKSTGEKLSAEEYNTVLDQVKENKEGVGSSVKAVKLDSRPVAYPDSQGLVTLTSVSQDSVLRFVFAQDYPPELISTTGSITLQYRFLSQNENEEDTGETVQLKIQEFVNGGWSDIQTLYVASRPATSTVWDTINFADYFGVGTRRVRLYATGQETAKTTTASYTITLTKLGLVNVTPYHQVQHVQASGSIYFQFAVAGNIPVSEDNTITRRKRILFQVESYNNNILQQYGTTENPISYSLESTEVHSQNNPLTLSIPLTSFQSHTSGAYTIKAVLQYILVQDGVTTVVDETDYVFGQILVEEEGTPLNHPYIIIQGIKSNLVNTSVNIKNYESTTLLDYAIYNPTEDQITVYFSLSNSLGTTTYWSGNLVANPTATDQNLTSDSLIVMAEVEDAVNDTINSVFRTTINGPDTNFLLLSLDTSSIAVGGIANSQYSVKIDNSEKFVPTVGVDFFMNPKLRSNNEGEATLRTIQNAAQNNTQVPATFNNVHFIEGVDGWTVDDVVSQPQKVLRLLAGSDVTIGYYPFSQFAENPASNMTMELDFAVRNVLDDTEPIISICGEDQNQIYGIQLKPTEGVIMSTSKTTYGEQDFHWQEGVRTHVMINILSRYYPTDDPSFTPSSDYGNNGMPMIRVFINGIINREIIFNKNNTSEFCPVSAPQIGIKIGNSSSDIDIYSMRCYKSPLTTVNCQTNYAVSLPSGDDKAKFRADNDILNENDEVDFNKASQRFNCLIWHGPQPYGATDETQQDTEGWLEIRMLNDDYSIDQDASGTFCRDTHKMPCKGQGTTAKTYYYWNLQWDLSKVKAKTTVDGQEVTDGYRRLDGTWHGSTYAVSSDVPEGQKMVMKINYASSMQSHKQGATALYNDLYRQCVGATEIQSYEVDGEHPYDKTRVAVLERAVMFFVQETDGADIKFFGLGTFGPGKMDKKTWGYDKAVFLDFAMFEGADNNNPLTDMRVPWGDDFATFGIQYNPTGTNKETYTYNGIKNINFDAGKTTKINGEEYPTGAAVTALKAAWNFLFNHNPRIKAYDGNYSQFLAEYAYSKTLPPEEQTIDLTYQYYMKQADSTHSEDSAYGDAYNLFRYDFVHDSWVPAGYDPNTDANVRKNLLTLYGAVPAATDEQETEFYAYRIAMHAKNGLTYTDGGVQIVDNETIADHFHVESLKFHYVFVVLFLAGTDNCSKNTYYVISPISHKIEMHADDLDTIFKTDNSGFQLKPYYIDRIHNGPQYYEGNANVLNNLLELMFEGEHSYAVGNSVVVHKNQELRDKMFSVFSAMVSLVGADEGYARTPYGCIDKYFFSIQKYFPAVAYNETARVRYEIPEYVGYRSSGRRVPPITQSLGDQLQSEMNYLKQRIVMVSSFGAYGDFGFNSTNNLGMTRGASLQSVYMHITSALYLYPNFRNGQSLTPQPYQFHLMKANDTYDLDIGVNATETDTAYGLNGRDFFFSFGDLSDYRFHSKFSQGSRLDISGTKLKELKVMDNTNATFFDIRGGITISNAPIFEHLEIHSPKFYGPVDVSSLKRLKVVNLVGTHAGVVSFPQTPTLTTIKLPAGQTVVKIAGVPNLTVFTMEDFASLVELEVDSENVGTVSIIRGCYADSAPLQSLKMYNIAWTGVSQDVMNYILNIDTVVLTGTIAMNSCDFNTKCKLIDKFGDIDDPNNSLYITYPPSVLGNAYITGEDYFTMYDDRYAPGQQPMTKRFNIAPAAPNQNSIKAVRWRLISYNDDPSAPEVPFNSNIGEIVVGDDGQPINDRTYVDIIAHLTLPVTTHEAALDNNAIALLRAEVDLTDGTTMTYLTNPELQWEIGFYDREVCLFDIVYHDGWVSNLVVRNKAAVGICWYLGYKHEGDTRYTDRRMHALVAASQVWGLYPQSRVVDGVTINGSDGFYNLKYDANLGDTDPSMTTDVSFDVPNLTNYSGSGYCSPENMTQVVNGKRVFRTGTSYMFRSGLLNLQPQVAYLQQYAPIGAEVIAQYAGQPDMLIPEGQYNTLMIVAYRERLTKGIQWPMGDTNTDIDTDSDTTIHSMYIDNEGIDSPSKLATQITNIRNAALAAGVVSPAHNKYCQFFYPAASYCYCYEPVIAAEYQSQLLDKFKKHNWYLPASGELARQFFYMMCSEEDIGMSGVRGSISWKNADVAASDPSGVGITDFKGYKYPYENRAAIGFTWWASTSGHWSSTEFNAGYAYYLGFSSGYLASTSKYGSLVCRASAAF